LVQFPTRDGPQIAWTRLSCGPCIGPIENVLRSLIAKGPYHVSYYTLYNTVGGQISCARY
jgi:hypothetical protein